MDLPAADIGHGAACEHPAIEAKGIDIIPDFPDASPGGYECPVTQSPEMPYRIGRALRDRTPERKERPIDIEEE